MPASSSNDRMHAHAYPLMTSSQLWAPRVGWSVRARARMRQTSGGSSSCRATVNTRCLHTCTHAHMCMYVYTPHGIHPCMPAECTGNAPENTRHCDALKAHTLAGASLGLERSPLQTHAGACMHACAAIPIPTQCSAQSHPVARTATAMHVSEGQLRLSINACMGQRGQGGRCRAHNAPPHCEGELHEVCTLRRINVCPAQPIKANQIRSQGAACAVFSPSRAHGSTRLQARRPSPPCSKPEGQQGQRCRVCSTLHQSTGPQPCPPPCPLRPRTSGSLRDPTCPRRCCGPPSARPTPLPRSAGGCPACLHSACVHVCVCAAGLCVQGQT